MIEKKNDKNLRENEENISRLLKLKRKWAISVLLVVISQTLFVRSTKAYGKCIVRTNENVKLHLISYNSHKRKRK